MGNEQPLIVVSTVLHCCSSQLLELTKAGNLSMKGLSEICGLLESCRSIVEDSIFAPDHLREFMTKEQCKEKPDVRTKPC